MAKMVKKSVIPFYLAAAVWLVWALAFSLYRVSDYVLCAVVSVIVFILGKAIFPDKTYALPDPPGQEKAAKAGPEAKAEPKAAAEPEPKPKRPSTGDAELDKILDERDMAISETARSRSFTRASIWGSPVEAAFLGSSLGASALGSSPRT